MNYQSNYLISDTESEIDSIFNEKYLKETRGKSFIGGAVKQSDFKFNKNFTPSNFLFDQFINKLEDGVKIDLDGEAYFNTETYENMTEDKTITYKDARNKPTEIMISYSSILDVLKTYIDYLKLKSNDLKDKVLIIDEMNNKNLSDLIVIKAEEVKDEEKKVIEKILDNTKVTINFKKVPGKFRGFGFTNKIGEISNKNEGSYGNISFTVDSGLKTELEKTKEEEEAKRLLEEEKTKEEEKAKRLLEEEKTKEEEKAKRILEEEKAKAAEREAAKAQGTRRMRTSNLKRASDNLIDTKIFVQFINEMKTQLITLAKDLKSMENIEDFFDFKDNKENERKTEFKKFIKDNVEKLMIEIKESKESEKAKTKNSLQIFNANIKVTDPTKLLLKKLKKLKEIGEFDSLIYIIFKDDTVKSKALKKQEEKTKIDGYLNLEVGVEEEKKKNKIIITMLFLAFLINSENINVELKEKLFDGLQQYFKLFENVIFEEINPNFNIVIELFEEYEKNFSGDYNLLELENLEKIFDNDQGLFDEVNLIENAEDLTNEYLGGIRTTLDTKAKELKTKLVEFKEEEEKQKQIKDAATESIQLAEKTLETIAIDKDSTSKEVTNIEGKLQKVKTLLQIDGEQNHTLIKFLQLKKGSKERAYDVLRKKARFKKCSNLKYLLSDEGEKFCQKNLSPEIYNNLIAKAQEEEEMVLNVDKRGDVNKEYDEQQEQIRLSEGLDATDDNRVAERTEEDQGDLGNGQQEDLGNGHQEDLGNGEEETVKKYRKLPSILNLGLKNFI